MIFLKYINCNYLSISELEIEFFWLDIAEMIRKSNIFYIV